jgi:hypothetical protein
LHVCGEAISGASFRDPAGYVFEDDGVIKRIVTIYGSADYRQLMSSGLYEQLVLKSMLVPHNEQPVSPGSDIAAILVPEQIPYVSYPYEWCFGQFRDAALLTLQIQEAAMQHGMTLKDASAFNIQFRGSRPVFIDTLSFEPNDGGPWVAYNQFCRHFLAPLLLMSYVSPAFNQFWKASLDGFSLDLTSSLLPRRTYLSLGIMLHIHLHARTQKKYQGANGAPIKALRADRTPDRKPALVDSLKSIVSCVKPGRLETEWLHYYDQNATHYSSAAGASKKRAVQHTLDCVKPRLVYDVGGNIGEYSRLAVACGAYTICFDIDPLCVHQNYERARGEKDERMLPLLLDLTNPTPSLGFALRERASVLDRGQASLVMALAVLHHLRITGNAPLQRIAAFLSQLGEVLLLEYVPKSDVMAQALLQSRKDTFLDYTDDGFRRAFEAYFDVEKTFPVADTDRTLFLFRKRQ